MPLQAGDTFPDVQIKMPTKDGIETVSTGELFAGKKVVLVGVPGAFTPTCNDTHLPGFVIHSDEIKAKGVDMIACVAVNDPFVMGAWGKSTNASDRVVMLSDGNGDLARALGLELDLSGFGMGRRSRRFAAVIDDGKIELLNVEPGGEVGVSGADTILEAL